MAALGALAATQNADTHAAATAAGECIIGRGPLVDAQPTTTALKPSLSHAMRILDGAQFTGALTKKCGSFFVTERKYGAV